MSTDNHPQGFLGDLLIGHRLAAFFMPSLEQDAKQIGLIVVPATTVDHVL